MQFGAVRTRGHGAQRSVFLFICARLTTPVYFSRSMAVRAHIAIVSRTFPFHPSVAGRSLSSLPPSTSKLVSENSPLPDPPITRKVRVELRPSPVKFDATRPAVAASPVPSKLNTPPRVTPNASSPSPSSDSVTETTRRDFEHAASHGILTPPPPDAGHFKRLMHQAWQLMVRTRIFFVLF